MWSVPVPHDLAAALELRHPPVSLSMSTLVLLQSFPDVLVANLAPPAVGLPACSTTQPRGITLAPTPGSIRRICRPSLVTLATKLQTFPGRLLKRAPSFS